MIKKLSRGALVVQFKLELDRKNLFDKAYRSLTSNKVDLVVANALSDLRVDYRAMIIDKDKKIISVNSKKSLARHLATIINCRRGEISC